MPPFAEAFVGFHGRRNVIAVTHHWRRITSAVKGVLRYQSCAREEERNHQRGGAVLVFRLSRLPRGLIAASEEALRRLALTSPNSLCPEA